MKATTTATVHYAGLTLTTHLVQSEEGNVQFYVLASELANAFGASQNKPSQWLERLQVKSLVLHKIQTKSTDGKLKENTCIALTDLTKVVVKLALAGNELATELVEDLSGLALTQLAHDAFGLQFEKAERQAWLAIRAKGKETRRTLTDAAKDSWAKRVGGEPPKGHYAELTDQMYLKVFGMRAATLRRLAKVKPNAPLRDYLTEKQLGDIEAAERILVNLIDSGYGAKEAIENFVWRRPETMWSEAIKAMLSK